MSDYLVLGYYLRIDYTPSKVFATLYDIDDVREQDPISEATGATADEAVASLINAVSFDTTHQ